MHLANSEFTENHRRLIRECIDNGAQTALWMNSNEHEQAKIFETLRSHYGAGTEEVGLTVDEDLQSLRIFKKIEFHKALDTITREHGAKFRLAIQNAGTDYIGGYNLSSETPSTSQSATTGQKLSGRVIFLRCLEDLNNLWCSKLSYSSTNLREM